ncbi:MAG: FAD-dependent thymidylate synthase [Clostridia bacterium]|nr:FAD-dependent thymidylate synthase [Clostridia bacterium]
MEIKLLGGTTKEELEKRIQKVASAGKLSRFPGNVFEVLEATNDYESNLKIIKRIIKMGHKSIIEHDYLVFAICDVTPIIEQIIIGTRLASFTIKSRREVDFRTAGFFIPEFRNKSGKIHEKNDELKKKYTENMQNLFNVYGDIHDMGVPAEDARFILPYSYHSNIIMGLDARQLERMIASFTKGNLSKFQEVKEFGNKLYEIAESYVPYLIPGLNKLDENLNNPFDYLDKNVKKPDIKILEDVKMISYTENADNIVLLSSIMYHYQCSKEQAKEILKSLEEKDSDARRKLMQIILHKEERRELEQVNFTFQIPISLSILTHLTRHRMHALLVPEFIPMWDLNNYVIPATIKANKDLEKLYIENINKNIEVYKEFKETVFEEDLVYFYIGAQMLNVVTAMNARTLQWICRMRCCNKAQWQIRNVAKSMASQVKEIAPLIGEGLGATCITDKFCGEGRESCGLIEKILEAEK